MGFITGKDYVLRTGFSTSYDKQLLKEYLLINTMLNSYELLRPESFNINFLILWFNFLYLLDCEETNNIANQYFKHYNLINKENFGANNKNFLPVRDHV